VLTDVELIRKLDFFEPLDPKIIKKIAKMCIVREFASGDYIVKQGEAGLGLYFITRGRAKVEIDRDGTRVAVAELRGGDFLGDMAMIDDKARSADVVCEEETSCLLLTRDSFSKLLNKYPQIAIQMAKSLVARIRATNQRVGPAPRPPQTSVATPADSAPGLQPAVEPVVTSSNGSSGTAFNILEMYSSTKDKAKEILVDWFSSLYLLKSMTRFSMAIVGCPVEVQPENRRPEVLESRIDGVRLALFPACGNQVLRMDAFGDGPFSATVFRPSSHGRGRETSVVCFEGSVRKNETLRLHIPAGKDTWLERA